jgi:DNA-binding NarL/FixJ family response regulator
MSRTQAKQSAECALGYAVRTLVVSQHEAVRQQLVAYLSRSPGLAVSGAAFSPPGIVEAHPDVLVLDLSRLALADLRAAIEAAGLVGAKLIALASLRDPRAEQLVLDAGGRYQLKSAGADGLAELVQEAVAEPALAPPTGPCQPTAIP